MASTIYDTNLDKNPANFQPLTPLTFLERSAARHPGPDRDHPRRLHRNYRDFYARSVRGRHGRRHAAPTRRPCSNAITACR